MQGRAKREPLRWIHAQAGKTVRLIAIDDVDYLRSDAKYTLVGWRDSGKPAEAVVRTPLKELLEQLDSERVVPSQPLTVGGGTLGTPQPPCHT